MRMCVYIFFFYHLVELATTRGTLGEIQKHGHSEPRCHPEAQDRDQQNHSMSSIESEFLSPSPLGKKKNLKSQCPSRFSYVKSLYRWRLRMCAAPGAGWGGKQQHAHSMAAYIGPAVTTRERVCAIMREGERVCMCEWVWVSVSECEWVWVSVITWCRLYKVYTKSIVYVFYTERERALKLIEHGEVDGGGRGARERYREHGEVDGGGRGTRERYY